MAGAAALLPLLAVKPKLPPGTKAGALADRRIVLLPAGASVARVGGGVGGVGATLETCDDLDVDDSSANAVRPKSPAGFLDGLRGESVTEAADDGLVPLRGVVTNPRC